MSKSEKISSSVVTVTSIKLTLLSRLCPLTSAFLSIGVAEKNAANSSAAGVEAASNIIH